MKFLVDELPIFAEDECPFCKTEWWDNKWINICNITDVRSTECDLGEAPRECNGLKKLPYKETNLKVGLVGDLGNVFVVKPSLPYNNTPKQKEI